MGNWKLVVPEGGTNLIDNPSFETGTTGWSASGTNTIAQSADEQKFGVYSLECTYQNNTTLASFNITLTAAQHTWACWIFILSNWDGGDINLDIANFTSATIDTASGAVDSANTGTWVRLDMQFTPDGGDLTGDLIVETDSAPTAGRDIHIDAGDCVAKGYDTTHIDGDQEDCEWNGAEHASTSTRVAYGIGGRVRDFDDDLDFPALEMQGIGAPPVSLLFNEQSRTNRSALAAIMHQRRQMVFRTSIKGSSLSNMHSLRQTLIKALDPLTGLANDAPRLRRLRYTGAGVDKEIDVAYDDGLGLQDKEGFTDEAPVSVIAPDPNFYQVGEAGATLDVIDTITIRAVAARVDGRWDALGPPHSSGTYTNVRAVVVDEENGYIYFGGDFVNFNNIANADGIVRYDVAAETYAALGTGTSGSGNDTVYDMALAPNGDLYVVGDFLNMGGVANADRVAMWDGSSWNALGTGLDDIGRAVVITAGGNVYAGGDFAAAGGTTVNNVGYWDGSSWNTVDSGPGLDDSVWALEVVPTSGGAQHVYCGGAFRAETGGTAGDFERFAIIEDVDGTPTFASVIGSSTGFNNTVRAIKYVDGRVYFGGAFTQDSDGNNVRRIAVWYGNGQPSELGGGVSGGIEAIFPAPDGTLWLAGTITYVDADRQLFSQLNGLVKRVGDTWASPRIGLNAGGASNTVYAIAGYKGDVYIGHDYSGSTGIAGSTDITYTGTAPTYPVIKIQRSGGTSAHLYEIVNRETGAVLTFDQYPIQDGETVIIDTRPGNRAVYNNKGVNLLRYVSDATDMGAFYLTGGNSGDKTNTIEVFVSAVGSPTMTATMRYRVAYKSAD